MSFLSPSRASPALPRPGESATPSVAAPWSGSWAPSPAPAAPRPQGRPTAAPGVRACQCFASWPFPLLPHLPSELSPPTVSTCALFLPTISLVMYVIGFPCLQSRPTPPLPPFHPLLILYVPFCSFQLHKRGGAWACDQRHEMHSRETRKGRGER